MGQFYESDAIASDGSTLPEPTRDPDLYYEQSTVPGSHLPHAWVGNHKAKYAMLDLAPYTRFTLFTGIAGEAWEDAARKVSADLGVEVETVDIGPRSEEHTSELQSLMRKSYAVFCLKKKKPHNNIRLED